MSAFKQFLTEAAGDVWLMYTDLGDKRDSDLDMIQVFGSEQALVKHMVEIMDPDLYEHPELEKAAKLLKSARAVMNFIDKHGEHLGHYNEVFQFKKTKIKS